MCVFIFSIQRVQHFNKFTTKTGFYFILAWTMIIQWLYGFITFTVAVKQFNLFIFFCPLSISSHQTTVTGRFIFTVDTHVKSRKYPEHHYLPDQSRSIRGKNLDGRLCHGLPELHYMYHKDSFHLIYINITVVN